MRRAPQATQICEVKPEIRVLGLDDGPFRRGDKKTLLVGTVFRGGIQLDGVLCRWIEVDGRDSTDKIVEMVTSSKHAGQLRVIMSESITFGGFNLMDIKEVHERTGLPVIAVTKDRPNMRKVRLALKKFPDFRERWELVKKAGKIYSVKLGERRVYLQLAGIEVGKAKEILEVTTVRGFLPEPVRVAHLIATGIVKGDSAA
jgi:endonuclease V-like protein UPF0215 family